MTEEVPSRLMERTYKRECRLQIGSSITYKKGGGDTATSDVAHGIHKELYGNVLERLYLLSHKIQTASKDECENITRSLIDDLLG